MSTWQIGDSWITTHGLTLGVSVGKMLSRQEALEMLQTQADIEFDKILRPDRVAQRQEGSK